MLARRFQRCAALGFVRRRRALAKVHRCFAGIVLRHVPIERHALARSPLPRRAAGERLCAARDFSFDGGEKLGQAIVDGAPDKLLLHVFVVVPVNVSSGGDFTPRDFPMPVFDLAGKTAGRFGDDFEAAGRGVKVQGFWQNAS